MARGRWQELQKAARSRRARAEAIASVAVAEEQFRRALERELRVGQSRIIQSEEQFERERRLSVDLRTHGRRRRVYPTSGDPNIIGEHEVAPVRCPDCQSPLPWPLIKGWRD